MKKEFEFGENITFIIAPNASGKTNILEAVRFLSSAKSFKAKIESECINYNEQVANINSNIGLEITLTRGTLDIGRESLEKVPKKKLLVNGISRRMIDFAGNLKTTLFLPEDIDLVTGSPAKRRNYLDSVLSQIDLNYRKSLLIYEKGVRQRNRLLFRIREENLSRSHLLFWNQILIKNGNYLTKKRQEFINTTNNYQFQINTNFQLEYDSSIISESRLEQYKNEEIASANTLVGPHRDDFAFQKLETEKNQKIQALDLASFGSRGEQRMGVLWLKMAEIKFIEASTDSKPVLLLDDIFSELDHMHRKVVIDLINGYQSIITTADEHFVDEFKSENINIINLH